MRNPTNVTDPLTSRVPDPVRILGVPVHPVTTEELHHFILGKVRQRARSLILHVNAHCLNLAYAHPWLRHFLNTADLVFADGVGAILAALLQGVRIPGRITYADWLPEFASFAQRHGLSLFLLGARPGVAEEAAAALVRRAPGLRIVGTHHGYFDKSATSRENKSVVHLVNHAQPHILLVAFGMPTQERWLMENWPALRVNVALTAGAALDYVSGRLRRPPYALRAVGLEWLGRLLIEPKRLWRRYIIGNPQFLYRVLLERAGLLRLP